MKSRLEIMGASARMGSETSECLRREPLKDRVLVIMAGFENRKTQRFRYVSVQMSSEGSAEEDNYILAVTVWYIELGGW